MSTGGREKAAAGILFVLGLMLIVGGFTGRFGDLLGAVFAPDQMQLAEG